MAIENEECMKRFHIMFPVEVDGQCVLNTCGAEKYELIELKSGGKGKKKECPK